MPNPWTGKGNPYTRKEVIERLRATLKRGEPIIAAGAGTGISAKFIEKGGADLIIIYNSGRFRMSGQVFHRGLFGSCASRRLRTQHSSPRLPVFYLSHKELHDKPFTDVMRKISDSIAAYDEALSTENSGMVA